MARGVGRATWRIAGTEETGSSVRVDAAGIHYDCAAGCTPGRPAPAAVDCAGCWGKSKGGVSCTGWGRRIHYGWAAAMVARGDRQARGAGVARLMARAVRAAEVRPPARAAVAGRTPLATPRSCGIQVWKKQKKFKTAVQSFNFFCTVLR